MLKGIAHLWNKHSDIKVLCRGVIKLWLVSINRDFRRISYAGGSITPGPGVPSGAGAFRAGPGGAEPPQPGRNPGRAEASSARTDFIRTRILHHLLCQPGKESRPHCALPLLAFSLPRLLLQPPALEGNTHAGAHPPFLQATAYVLA